MLKIYRGESADSGPDDCFAQLLAESRTPPPPASPTAARPGTPEKIDVMRARLERGEALFHPDDGAVLARLVPSQTGGRSRRSAGVCRHKGRWRARVWVPAADRTAAVGAGASGRGRLVHLGLYATEALARAAVLRAEARLAAGAAARAA